MSNVVRAAAVQAEPVWFDSKATAAKTVRLIREASARGANIVAFPETWLPGYPVFLHYTDINAEMPFVAEYLNSAISIDGPEIDALREAAREHNIMVAVGFAERGGRSLYMSQAVISQTGEVVIHRRKLKPTYRERTLFGQGDGSDLRVVDTSLGRVGALMCWEHLQPLNKMAMLGLGEQIHVASWPQLDFYGGPMMAGGSITAVNQTYALECGAFVLMSTQTLSAQGRAAFNRYGVEIPAFEGGGCASIFSPTSMRLTEPLPAGQEGIVYADLNMGEIAITNYLTDPAGHYSRPDIFTFAVDMRKKRAVSFVRDEAPVPALRAPAEAAQALETHELAELRG